MARLPSTHTTFKILGYVTIWVTIFMDLGFGVAPEAKDYAMMAAFFAAAAAHKGDD